MNVKDDQRQRRVRRNAILLGVAALLVYLSYIGYFVLRGGVGG